MEKEIPLYQMIYNKLVNRILLGLYPKGYQLSSVERIHSRYSIGYTSIRRALRLLSQEGFLRLEERRRPVVIFDAEEPQGRELRRRVFLSRRQAHLGCCRAIPCLIPGLAVQGARRCGPRVLALLEALCGTEPLTCRSELLTLTYAWLSLVVRQADSQLAEDLLLQIRGFDDLRLLLAPGQPLMPGEAKAARLTLRHWTDLLRRGQWEDLHTLVSVFCWQAAGELERDLAVLAGAPGDESVRQVSFHWYVRQLPTPLYQRIAWDLLRNAYWEGMEPGACFPPEAEMMGRYGVSAVTVRGALAMLNTLGLVRTVNGVGTLLTGAPAEGESGSLRECLESLAILMGSGRALAAAAAPRLSEGEREALAAGAAFFRQREGLLLWLLLRLAAALQCQPLENVLEQLEVRYLFGLYIRGIPGRPERQPDPEALFRRASACLALLEAGETEAFAAQFGLLCREYGEEMRERLA